MSIGTANKALWLLLRGGDCQRAERLLDLLAGQNVAADVATYATLVSMYSDLDKPQDALRWADHALSDKTVVPNEVLFCALRSFCRTHGFEKQWPRFRAWCVEVGGVKAGLSSRSWRDESLDPISRNAAQLLYPR